MDSRIIKALIGLIVVFIAVVGVFGILPQMGVKSPFEGFENPLSGLIDNGKNAAANAALDASGIKTKAAQALEDNRDKIAAATGLSTSEVDAAIDALDIESWEVTSLPADAEQTGSTDVSYEGANATVKTYDDPSVVTVQAMGQDVTLAVPETAQDYVKYLEYLG